MVTADSNLYFYSNKCWFAEQHFVIFVTGVFPANLLASPDSANSAPTACVAARQDRTGARLKVKEEVMDSSYAGALGREGEFGRTLEHVARLKQTAREPAAAAGFASPSSEVCTGSEISVLVSFDLTPTAGHFGV